MNRPGEAVVQRRQCKHCPWKVSANPRDIPNGYCESKHRALHNTIARDAEIRTTTLRLMACHEAPVGREVPCVGWLHNQLGPGNNIGLRLAVSTGRVSADYKLDGEQHQQLKDTLPAFRAEGGGL